MARIEELPGDFEGSLNLNEAPQLDADYDAVFEEMYNNNKGPEKPETNPKSFEEVMQELSKTPLFMNDLNDVANAGTLDLSHHGALSTIAENYPQMVRMQAWMLSEHYNMKAPKSTLPKASKSRGMKW